MEIYHYENPYMKIPKTNISKKSSKIDDTIITFVPAPYLKNELTKDEMAIASAVAVILQNANDEGTNKKGNCQDNWWLRNRQIPNSYSNKL